MPQKSKNVKVKSKEVGVMHHKVFICDYCHRLFEITDRNSFKISSDDKGNRYLKCNLEDCVDYQILKSSIPHKVLSYRECSRCGEDLNNLNEPYSVSLSKLNAIFCKDCYQDFKLYPDVYTYETIENILQ